MPKPLPELQKFTQGLWCKSPYKTTHLTSRHWDRWLTENKVKHIHMVRFSSHNVSSWNTTSSAPIDIMKGIQASSPASPFGGKEMYGKKSNYPLIL